MSGPLLPICAIVFSLLLCIMFFGKKRIDLFENNLYGIMLIAVLFDSILVSILHIIALSTGVDTPLFIVNLFNKIDFLLLIIYCNCVFIYTMLITYTDLNNKKKPLILVTTVFDVMIYFLILINPISILNDGTNFSISGLSVLLMLITCGLYILLSIIVTIINVNNITKKHIPILSIVGIIAFLIIIFQVNPYLVIVSISLTFINYIMYFTIENPDVKMIEQLELAKEQAEKANRAKTDFLSSMSHEIRTPLNAISGFSDCILESNSLEEAKENAKDIVDASSTLIEIVNGILDVSKIEAGKLEIINSPYKAKEVFEELATLVTPKMTGKGLDFSYYIAPDIPDVLCGDYANIKKVITNLLSNACKYTEKGFVRYEVNCVTIKNYTRLIISVEDSGRGIKKESIDKMFSKFQRLEEDRNTTIEGTGLGLAITKQLTELMGGKIIVHSIYGKGSKFTVVINQKISDEEIKEKKKYKTTLNLNNIKILLVDDNALNIKVAKKILESFNANMITTCDSGFKCLDIINDGEKFDIILLDDMMPKMSGVETLKKLKEIRGFKIPTIALTANAITGMKEKYLKDGFNNYLSKPIEKEDLIQVMNEVLGRVVTEQLPIVDEKEEHEKEEKSKEIIPVDEHIEEELGSKLDLSFVPEEKNLEEKEIHVDHFNEEEKINDNVPLENDVIENDEKVDVSYLEENGVDINHALELLGDMEMYNDTVDAFLEDADDRWNRIVEYKNNSDMENYAIEVHSLKSDSKYLGFMSLADIAYQHELKSKDNDVDFVINHFSDLEKEFRRVLEVVKKYNDSKKMLS